MIGIYKITSPTDKIYIGQSVDIDKRWYVYTLLQCKSQPKLYNSFLKHGVKKHIFEVVEECSIEELNKLERKWQEVYNVVGVKGLNCVLAESDTVKKKLGEEVKQKISKANKGKIRSELVKSLMSVRRKGTQTGLNHWAFGKKKSEEAVQNMRAAITGRKLSEEHKKKISIGGKGKVMSELSKLKGSLKKRGELNPMYQKKHTGDTRKKMSETRLGRSHSKEHSKAIKEGTIGVPKKNSRWVLNLETGIFYESIANAARYNNIHNVSYFGRKLNGKEVNNTSFIILEN